MIEGNRNFLWDESCCEVVSATYQRIVSPAEAFEGMSKNECA